MVRSAETADAAAIARMLHEFNLEFEEWTPGPDVLEPRVREFIAAGTKVFLVCGDQGDEGFAQLDFIASIWSDEPVAHLDELYVKPELRGGGRGQALMERAVELARERGAPGIEVVTGEDDTAARELYESTGFVNEIEGPDNTRSLFYELEF